MTGPTSRARPHPVGHPADRVVGLLRAPPDRLGLPTRHRLTFLSAQETMLQTVMRTSRTRPPGQDPDLQRPKGLTNTDRRHRRKESLFRGRLTQKLRRYGDCCCESCTSTAGAGGDATPRHRGVTAPPSSLSRWLPGIWGSTRDSPGQVGEYRSAAPCASGALSPANSASVRHTCAPTWPAGSAHTPSPAAAAPPPEPVPHPHTQLIQPSRPRTDIDAPIGQACRTDQDQTQAVTNGRCSIRALVPAGVEAGVGAVTH